MLLNIFIWTIIISAILGIAFFFFHLMYSESYERRIVLPSHIDMSRKNSPKLLQKLEEIFSCPNKEIIVDFSRVTSITNSAYMVIMAQAEKSIFKKEKTVKFALGNNVDVMVKVMFNNNNSCVHHRYFAYDKLKDNFKNKSKELDPSKVIFAIEKDLKKIDVTDYFELNTLITELIGNAVEHGIQDRNINWWLHHRFDAQSKSVKISFVDMGIGIVGSHRNAGLPSGYVDKGDRYIVADSLNGKLRSSTGDDNRGRGLRQILNMIENNWLSDFILITNTVSVRFINNKLQYQDHLNFVGTFYSFSINKNNFEQWKRKLSILRKISA